MIFFGLEIALLGLGFLALKKILDYENKIIISDRRNVIIIETDDMIPPLYEIRDNPPKY
jgi:hypothetical protein